MGGALLERWLASGLRPACVTIIDPQPKSAPEGVVIVPTVEAAEAAPQAVVLAIKPQLLDAVTAPLANRVVPETLLVSILAGVRHASLSARFKARIVRAMPNTPARLGLGTTALFGEVAPDSRDMAESLMAAVGRVHWIESEELFDAITAVSGSGPAYLFRFIEAMEAAAVAAGIPQVLAADLALETVTGAAALAARREASPGVLREQVTSPNGTTAAGLAVLDGDRALTSLLSATVAAAAARSRELAKD